MCLYWNYNMIKKYPIGTKIIFTAKLCYNEGAKDDSGKIGTVMCDHDTMVDIFIPDSKNNKYTYGRVPKVTWHVPWDTIKLVKGQQLLFDFMNEAT